MHASKCKELTQAINRRKAMHRQCISQYSATGRMPTHEAVHAYIAVHSFVTNSVEDVLCSRRGHVKGFAQNTGYRPTRMVCDWKSFSVTPLKIMHRSTIRINETTL